jgi:2,3-bisphosphoglycerate-independent phosphoglycerate mutase
MKYILVIGDGMSDEIRRDTPLKASNHPNMDFLASNGICGLAKTIPSELKAGSDVALLSILGYNPEKFPLRRGPIEAAGMGIKLGEDDLALRCNLVTVENGVLKDYSAGHITTEEAAKLLRSLEESGILGGMKIHVGVSYRHVAILKGEKYSDMVENYPPHDYVGEKIENLRIKPKSLEAVETAKILNEIMDKSVSLLSSHPVNLERIRRGKNPGNSVWFWAPGRKPSIPSLAEMYGLRGAVISAVNVVRGLGVILGMEIIEVEGATGYFDTNYEGKADEALKALEKYDFVLVHVEAPDEAGHLGDFNLKAKTIEDLDRRLIGRIIERLRRLNIDYCIGVLADHATPIKVRTHTHDPIPFIFYSNRIKLEKTKPAESFNEESASKTGLLLEEGFKLMPLFLSLTDP